MATMVWTFEAAASVSGPTQGSTQSPTQIGTGVPFPGGKALPGCDADHSLHLVPRSRMSRSYTKIKIF
jgi:hypothetical protein